MTSFKAGRRLRAPLSAMVLATLSAWMPASAFAADATDAFEDQVLILINAERAKAGLRAVLLDLGLDAAAEAHSLDLATNNCFTHDSCNGTNWATRIKGFYTPNTFLGEIIAAGQPDAASVVLAWMNSDGHRANILNNNFTVAGVGLVNGQVGSQYRTYWTVDFGGATTSQTVPAAIPEPSTWALMLLGLGAMAAVRPRRS
jgi:uncharacterized protein YkwD